MVGSEQGMNGASEATSTLLLRANRLTGTLKRLGIEYPDDDPRLLPALLAARIGLIGNMNNNLFVVTRYLQDAGLLAELRPYPFEENHFQPEADSFDLTALSSVRAIGWDDIIRPTAEDLYRSIMPYDFIAGSGCAPAFFAKMGLPLDFFIPYGSDLLLIPFQWAEGEDFDRYRDANRLLLGRFQRLGIAEARGAQISNRQFGPAMRALRGERFDFCGLPLVFTPEYDQIDNAQAIKFSPLARQIAELRHRFGFVVFHHTRHSWTERQPPLERKGNDVLLRGFADFIWTTGRTDSCLVCFEYGLDVDESRRLIEELGIGANVVWFPVSQRKHIMLALRHCDVATGEFNIGWRFGGVIYEVLVAGRPLINHADWSEDGAWPSSRYPYLQARTADEISHALSEVAAQPEKFRETTAQARSWYDKQVTEHFLRGFLGQIVETIQVRQATPRSWEIRAAELRQRVRQYESEKLGFPDPMSGAAPRRPTLTPIAEAEAWDIVAAWASSVKSVADRLPDTVRESLSRFAQGEAERFRTDTATAGGTSP